MRLSPGQNVSYYEILEPLGAGGMGEVYRALDSKLGREVALKVLPRELADDDDRLLRFEREARTLVSLNHPNVAGIFGVDQVEEVCFLALELVPGEDLATPLSRGPLPVDRAIDVCRQIAEGLEAAHEAGVVHRDLKPANVRVTPQGVIKILDFGLAKAIRPSSSEEVTATVESDSFLLTEEGVVLGTPTYMSPEQARGHPVDRRTDLWSLGCVLYECLTGTRPFDGSSMPDVFAAIVEREPDWSRLPKDTPPAVLELLRRALEKDPRTRLRDAGEARVLLERLRSEPAASWSGLVAEVTPGRGDERRLSSAVPAVIVALLALVAGAVAGRSLWPAADQHAVAPVTERHLVVLDQRTIPDEVPFSASRMAVSPDGQRLGIPAAGGLLIHSLDRLDPVLVPLPDDLNSVTALTWTPDSLGVVYAAGSELRRFEHPGGEHLPIAETEGVVQTLAIVGDAVFFTMGSDTVLQRVSLRGGVPEDQPAPRDGSHFHDLQPIPGTDQLLATRHWQPTVDGTRESHYWLSVVGPHGHQDLMELGARDEDPCLLAGHIVTERAGERSMLWAYPFSLRELAVTGEPFLLWPGRNPATSHEGDLFYEFGSAGMTQLASVGREGDVELLDQPRAGLSSPRLSPDGKRVAFCSRRELWVYDLSGKSSAQVATLESAFAAALWLPGGRLVTGGPKPMLLPSGTGEPVPWGSTGSLSWISADGTRAVLQDFRSKETLLQPLRNGLPEGEPELLRKGSRGLTSMSPDGNWYLFSSDHSGVQQYYVSPYPNTDKVWPLGHEIGYFAGFSAEGEEILFLTPGRGTLMTMSFTPGSEPPFGAPKPLFDLVELGLQAPMWSLDQKDGRFLMTKRIPSSESRIVLVQGWRGPNERD